MTISIKDVEHVAKLARLTLTEDEKRLYTEQLTRIIANFNELKEIDTTGIEPLAHALPLTNVLREDIVKPSLGRDVLLSNAPERDGENNEFFRVPKIGD